MRKISQSRCIVVEMSAFLAHDRMLIKLFGRVLAIFLPMGCSGAKSVPPKVRLIIQMQIGGMFPGDGTLTPVVKNETQGTISQPTISDYAYQVELNDYNLQDELFACVSYENESKGVVGNILEKIPLEAESIKQELVSELMAADGRKHDVMLGCKVRMRFMGAEWTLDRTFLPAVLIKKGADLYLPQ